MKYMVQVTETINLEIHPNIGQLYQFRKTILPKFFTLSFALGGGIGAFLGTILLVNLSIKI